MNAPPQICFLEAQNRILVSIFTFPAILSGLTKIYPGSDKNVFSAPLRTHFHQLRNISCMPCRTCFHILQNVFPQHVKHVLLHVRIYFRFLPNSLAALAPCAQATPSPGLATYQCQAMGSGAALVLLPTFRTRGEWPLCPPGCSIRLHQPSQVS